MPGIEGFGRERSGFESPQRRLEVLMSSAEAGIEKGFMREVTFDEAQDARLPSFVQLSPRIGMCFVRSGKFITQRDKMGGSRAVELFEGQLIKLPPLLSEKKIDKLTDKEWKTIEEMELAIKNSGVKKINRLNRKPVLFAGSLNGNYARDGRYESPADPSYNFAVVGIDINPDRHIEDGSGLLAIAHELGHANIFLSGEDRMYVDATYHRDRARLGRNRQQIGEYAARFKHNGFWNFSQYQIENNIYDIKKFYQFLTDNAFDKEFRIYHERHAWADGFRLLRRDKDLHKELQRIGNRKAVAYAQRCLETYRIGYEDPRFTHGPFA